jgi:hypothetical protein
MDRRSFMKGSLGAGAALATGGLLQAPTALAAKGASTGYQVGQRFPVFQGLDQYNRLASLRDFAGSWTLLDVCTWWCSPCRALAENHAAFRDHINASGIPFRLLSVIVEDRFGGVSVRDDAENWAVRFDLGDDIVIHCAGDPASTLRQINSAVALANGQTPGYPAYVLIDPSGVLRFHRGNIPLETVQAKLSEFTGVTIPEREWPIVETFPWLFPDDISFAIPALPVDVTGSRSNGDQIDETVDDDGRGTTVELGGNFVAVGFDTGYAPGFNLDQPLTMQFHPTPYADELGVYRLHVSSDVAIAEIDPISFEPTWIPGTAQVSWLEDATLELVCDPFRDHLRADADAFNYPFLRIGIYHMPTTPYTGTLQLEADVTADGALPGTIKDQVNKLLQSVRSKLAARDHAAAADKAARAANALQQAGAQPVLRINSAWLAAHLAYLASGATVQTTAGSATQSLVAKLHTH